MNSKLLKQHENTAFDLTYKRILLDLVQKDGQNDQTEINAWMKRVIDYNVPEGKHVRGMAVVSTFRLMTEHNKCNTTEEEFELSRVLGWAVEMFQAYCLVVDDIMDQSVTRRGKACWYNLPEIGLMAHNDAILINESAYIILRKYFSNKKYYQDIVDLMHEITRITCMGQYMDTSSNLPNSGPQFHLFTQSRYQTICRFKTAFYTTVLPIRLALYMFGMNSMVEHKRAENILLKIGILFQMNDDFMDCFVDPVITGKVGTDIEEGKCCWPVVTALELCNTEQLEVIKANYGHKDPECVLKVKAIYNELNLKDVFNREVKLYFKQISHSINELNSETQLNPKIFTQLLANILSVKLLTDFSNFEIK